jgi:hypothetical protein
VRVGEEVDAVLRTLPTAFVIGEFLKNDYEGCGNIYGYY